MNKQTSQQATKTNKPPTVNNNKHRHNSKKRNKETNYISAIKQTSIKDSNHKTIKIRITKSEKQITRNKKKNDNIIIVITNSNKYQR